ncbi:myosin heavy chain, clone 203 isoform X2 [Tribolium castaneum]|uniref:myosin heavy chain, clone 203 isoform X2 n=1 Tax=Tribolium castaneum TaxID=7070 RepID=UPI00046C25A5|nr:PREDICTED: myosin heavy chain, clone 203 isoform X2 [Tribolium castaneum]|eukprot:XP_008190978.1 PREDICTED: myosin heavy chain, clone 203 isoform X2 [Tribolium castaneum]
MNHKLRTVSNSETAATCEKYLNKMIRQEQMFAMKRSPPYRPQQDKISHIVKQPSVINQRVKPKVTIRNQSPLQKATAQAVLNVQNSETRSKDFSKVPKHRARSVSAVRLGNKEREAWGQILQSNKSKEKVSLFSNFDPLRTLHFLSKELFTKLENVFPEDEMLQMVADIQHALKRIPPEISTLLHNPLSEASVATIKNTAAKTCQTPPTLYQEDTEKFQKIMEENTYRLEASCKQLEIVCTNLQNEKELTEKELDQARENVEMLCGRVKELEIEMEEISTMKIKQLEEEKQCLQEQLNKAKQELKDNPTVNHLKKVVEDLKKQKATSEETCARLEYDMALLKMEKEKFVTMLAVRDKEIKEIQEEMTKIQDQVNTQLKKLNGDVLKRANSLKTLKDSSNSPQDLFLEIGDTTISSITSNDSDKEPINIIKESPCGDAEMNTNGMESQDNFFQKLKADEVEINLPTANDKDQDMGFEDLLQGLTPSVKALLASHNL